MARLKATRRNIPERKPGMWRRAIFRMAVAATVAVGAALVASPAQAHPVISGPNCDVGRGFVGCIISVSAEVPPLDIAWFINGVRITSCNDQFHCSGTCTIGTRVGIKVTVTDASNVPVSRAISKFCGTIIP